MKNQIKLFTDKGSLVTLQNQDKINLSHLIEKIIGFVGKKYNSSPKSLYGDREDRQFLNNRGLNFFTHFSTDLDEIIERQRLFQILRENKELIEFLSTNPAPVFPNKNYSNEIDLNNLYKGTVSYANYFEKIINLTKGTELNFISDQFFSVLKEHNIEHLKTLNFTQKPISIHLPVTLSIKKRDHDYDRFRFHSEGTIVGDIYVDNKTEPIMGALKGDFNIDIGSKGKKSFHYMDIDKSFLSGSLWGKVLNTYFRYLVESKDFKDEMTLQLELFYEEFNGFAKASFSDGKVNFNFFTTKNYNRFQKSTKPPKFFSLEDYNFDIPTTQFSCVSLYASSNFLSGRRRSMIEALCILEDITFLAHLACWYNKLPKNIKTCYPTVLPKEKKIFNIKRGINPVLFDLENVLPNDVSFSPQKRGYAISGANAGGKTAFADMVAYNQLLTQLGLLVFAEEAEISIVDNILLHYLENSDINANQSRHASELRRLNEEVIENVTEYSLVIFDEPFSGTSEKSGKKQAVAVLRIMSELGCRVVMTTHLHKIIPFVDKLPGFSNTHFVLPSNKKGDFIMKSGGLAKSFGESLSKEYHVTYGQMKRTIAKNKLKKQI